MRIITYAMTSAEGPSLAGPISDRVVKPEALRYTNYSSTSLNEDFMSNLPSTKTSHIRCWGRHGQKGQFVGFVGRHS